MKKSLLLLIGAIALAACNKSNTTSDTTLAVDSLSKESESISLYEQTDSTFAVNGKVFKVNGKLFDLTDLATANGDTLPRPTYSCAIKIFDSENKVVFKDSLLRESWGYEGKIASIDAYEIASPRLSFIDKEIILAFNIYERESEDLIEGCVAFNIETRESRYFWRESSASD